MTKTVLKKDKTVNVKTKAGATYSYKFTTLAEIHKYLEETNQRYYAFVGAIGDMTTRERVSDDYIYIQKLDKDSNSLGEPIRGARVKWSDNVQEYGGNLTSARRYSLLMAYGLACEDDDVAPLPTNNSQYANRGGGLNFEGIKKYLERLHTEEAVEKARVKLLDKYHNLTKKQQDAIARIFAERKDEILVAERFTMDIAK